MSIRVGRNAPCSCGSGLKYKHCHGNLQRRSPDDIVPERVLRLANERLNIEQQRTQQDGQRHAIISIELAGYRFVRVGSKTCCGPWLSLFNFLDYYIQITLGIEWFKRQRDKPLNEQHPILQWQEAFYQSVRDAGVAPGAFFQMRMTGAANAYFGLAYNLYLMAHNIALQKRFIKRLRNLHDFHGAYYETLVSAWFILADFHLAPEDEGDPREDHGEFIARSNSSGQSYWVEAKSRQGNKSHLGISTQLYKALKKTSKFDRIVMIDTNVSHDPQRASKEWLDHIMADLRRCESNLTTDQQPAPPAIIIVTNHPFHHDLETTEPVVTWFAEGFKVADFKIDARFYEAVEAFKARKRYADIWKLLETLYEYEIPSTFHADDTELGRDGTGRKWRIGERYDISEFDGASGILTCAGVSPQEHAVYLRFRLDDGVMVETRAPMGDRELEIYLIKRHRAYFGRPNITSPVDFLSFFYEKSLSMSREQLLQSFDAVPYNDVSQLSDDDLRLAYCERQMKGTMGMNFILAQAARNAPPAA
jgi:hypothetical protein